MSEQVVVIERVFVVRWSTTLTVQEIRSVTHALAEARRAQHRPLALVDVTDRDMPPLDEAVLAEFMLAVPTYQHACACAFAVVSASSPHHRLQVGSLEAMSAVAAIPSEICTTLEDALRSACLAMDQDLDATIAAAKQSPLLTGML